MEIKKTEKEILETEYKKNKQREQNAKLMPNLKTAHKLYKIQTENAKRKLEKCISENIKEI